MREKMRRGINEEEKCCAFTRESHTVIRSQPLSKLNALGLSARK